MPSGLQATAPTSGAAKGKIGDPVAEGKPPPIAALLARAAYEERILPSGHLDPARLAILTDALEEAGRTDEAILSHLRFPGPHVRGCWALDLILGKQ